MGRAADQRRGPLLFRRTSGVSVQDGETRLKRFVLRFLRDERGVTAIEYGLIIALISLVVIGGASAVFTKYGQNFNNIAALLN